MPNTVLAAAEGLPVMNRRRALFAATGAIASIGAVGAATAAFASTGSRTLETIPAAPAAAPESEIMTAFREWDALYEQTYDPEAEEISDELNEQMWAIEKQARAMPPSSPTDLLLKVFMSSQYCAFDMGDEVDALIAEARAVLS